MTFLPIVGRELRVAARRRGTYWTRVGIACVAIAFGGWVMLIPSFQTPQTLGLALFTSLSVVAFIYSLLAGVLTTADCLSEEKREGTLGLLFLTDLKGYDIVFGKLTAKSVNAAYGLLAILPVMAPPPSFRQFNFFYASVLCVHLMGCAFLVAACVIVPRSWQDRAEPGVTSRWRARWRRWGHGLPAARPAIRARMLAINPFYWLAGRDRMKTVLVWVFLGASALFALWCNWKFQMSAAIDSLYICAAL